jgi:hypothetical protein
MPTRKLFAVSYDGSSGRSVLMSVSLVIGSHAWAAWRS